MIVWNSVDSPATPLADSAGLRPAAREDAALMEMWTEQLRTIEADFQHDRQRGLHIEAGHARRATRWEEAYQFQRQIKSHLLKHPESESSLLYRLLQRALELARENALSSLEQKPGAQIVPRRFLRTAMPGGEPFQFFCLERETPFYTDPYQLTFSTTPPRHRQEIHGHFHTPELTVALDEGMSYEIYRFRDGRPVHVSHVEVPQFSAAYFGVRTPHTIINNTQDRWLSNATVKLRDQVTDRWNLAEGPDEASYTYEGRVEHPQASHGDGYSIYSFDKGPLVQRSVRIAPSAEYHVDLGAGGERGLFVAKGQVEVLPSDTPAAAAGDIIYGIAGGGDTTLRICNRVTDEAVLVEVALKEPVNATLNLAKSRRYRAIIICMEDVLTDPTSGAIADDALPTIHDLLARRVPMLVLGRQSSRIEQFSALLDTMCRSRGTVRFLDDFLLCGTEEPGRLTNGHLTGRANYRLYWQQAVPSTNGQNAQRQGIEILKSRFSLADSQIAAFASRAGAGELHRDLLARFGGFSTDSCDPQLVHVVQLRQRSGHLPGASSFLWALGQLHFDSYDSEQFP